MFEASNGADGLRIAQELRPSLILLDLVMPGLSGFQVLDLLRQSESTRGIPVVIVTGNPLTPGQKEALLKKGVATMAKNEVGEASMTLTVQQAMMRPSDLTLESRRTNQ
jgi:CheY-like chemotaxis protein